MGNYTINESAMLSRVADSLYWMSRYTKRTDSVLRMLKVNYASSQDESGFNWQPVLKIFSYRDSEEIASIERNSRAVLQYMVCDRENPNAVVNLVTKARENARSVQDNITKELWQCLNEFYHQIRDERVSQSLNYGDPITVLDALIRQSMLYYGIAESTMFRGIGSCFMNIGKHLERANQSVDILHVKVSDPHYNHESSTDITYWKHLLLSISGYALYLKTYRSGFEAKNVIDLVVFNTSFPQSIMYSINMLERYFERLRESSNPKSFENVRFMIGRLKSRIMYTNLEIVSQEGLSEFLTSVKHELFDIGNALNEHYFAHS